MLARLDQTRALSAIVIGRAGMDLYPLPDGTEIEAAASFAADIGGAGANIAVALARQGARAALLVSFSDDAVGAFVRRGLAAYGVDTAHCRTVAGEHRTSLALAETRADDCAVVIYRNGAADLVPPAAEVDAAFLGSAAALVVTGTALAAPASRAFVMEALRVARRAGTFAVLDIDHRAYSWVSAAVATEAYAAAAESADAVCGNLEELSLVAGGGDPEALARRLVREGARFVVVKRGAAGSTTFTVDGSFDTPPFPVTALKPFGAGDAFLGALIAALTRGELLPAAVRWGSAAAALVMARRGCASAMPTLAEAGSMLGNGRAYIGNGVAPDAHTALR